MLAAIAIIFLNMVSSFHDPGHRSDSQLGAADLNNDAIIHKTHWCQQGEESYFLHSKHIASHMEIYKTITSYVHFPSSTIQNMLRNPVPVFHF